VGLGAVITTSKIAAAIKDNFGLYSTYGWHPRAVAVALANLRYLTRHRNKIPKEAVKVTSTFCTFLPSMHPNWDNSRTTLNSPTPFNPSRSTDLLMAPVSSGRGETTHPHRPADPSLFLACTWDTKHPTPQMLLPQHAGIP
jgi:hypothetical protein